MNENNLNAELNEEVVQPQDDNGAEITEVIQEEIIEPQKTVDEMSDEEFLSYINTAQDGNVEVQDTAARQSEVDTAEQSAAEKDDTGDADPADVENKEPFKVFNTQEEYQSEFDRVIGERLKKSRESVETLEGLKQQALNFYGTDDGDTALRQLIDDLQAQNAEKRGVSVEDYDRQTRDSIDAQKYREEQSRISSEQERVAQIQQKWQNESEELKRIVPDFNFAKAMQNQAFYNNIVNGMSVTGAYLAVNQQTAQAEKPKSRKPIQQNGNAKGGNAGRVESNPASMSDADFARYIERIRG